MNRESRDGGLLDRIAHARPTESPDPRDILSSLGEVVYDWDLISDKLIWGPNVVEVLGTVDLSGIQSGAGFANLVAPQSGVARHEAIARSGDVDQGGGVRYHLHYAVAPSPSVDGALAWIEDTGRWFAGPFGRPARAHGVVRRVANASNARGANVSHVDPLTGALSRARFIELAGALFAETMRNRTQCAMMLIAVDGLPMFNQIYGYHASDQIIAGVSKCLARRLRSADRFGRYAGGKFAVAMSGCDSDQLAAAARRCIESVSAEAFDTEVGSLRTSVHIGGVIAPRYATTQQALFLNCEEALESARSPGGRRFVAYEPTLAREGARQKMRRVSEQIVAALNDRRVAIALEPVVAADTKATAFYEALMRIRLEDGAALAPSIAFQIAEKAGLAPLLDQRVLELAIERLARDPNLTLSVNMSGLTARDPEWPERTRSSLSANPGSAERLIIEITETCAIEDIEATQRTIGLLKECGVRIAMDDFGAGHTSFRNLRALKLDFVKIDGAFIQNLVRSPDDRFFVRTLIDLARHVAIPVVAEWVEDEETARLLGDWGVAYFQGSLFGLASKSLDVAAPDQTVAAA